MDLLHEFKKFNIDTVGVCSAKAYNDVCGRDYKVCIVALFPYFCGYTEGSNLSIYTHGVDYHIVTKSILSSVAENIGLTDYEIHSDIGPEVERTLAVDAGIAFVGKNGMAINHKYGSYFFIGYIACNADLPLSEPCNQSCMNCNMCINACPGGALGEEFSCDRCLSAITQKKGELSRWERDLVSRNSTIFGCDICQKVCPHNRDVVYTPIPEFKENRITNLTLKELEGLTNKTFKEKYGNRAFAWRGKAVLERNLKLTE